ncbi:L-proline trans-4-hydroxylase-like [Clavelina lepadiformis]|uniref:L-proline trans-4-hydroxylase-like n=1 Tax=Clavelina lepadiformis TaxID=159417 RepID=UPI004042ACE3
MEAKDLPVYQFVEGKPLIVTDGMKEDFWKNGFIIVRNLLTNAEVIKLRSSLERPESAVMGESYDQGDGDGRNIRLTLWNHPGNDLTGMINRCEKVVNTCQELIGGEVYHYHTKIVQKEPRTGGAFQWHQDYGYWYLNGVMFPDLISVQFAIDRADVGNGCLQVLRGSHRMGRIEHGRVGDQAGADIERVYEAEKVMEKIHVEMDPGDGLIFHCNLLHRSDQNNSDRRRWMMIACYNRADNNPTKDHHHARYTTLETVSNKAIMECKNLDDLSGKWFINPHKANLECLPTNPGKVR